MDMEREPFSRKFTCPSDDSKEFGVQKYAIGARYCRSAPAGLDRCFTLLILIFICRKSLFEGINETTNEGLTKYEALSVDSANSSCCSVRIHSSLQVMPFYLPKMSEMTAQN